MESWQALRDGNLLLEWALNLMVLNVSTRKYHRAVRLPEGDLAKARGDGTSKSAVSRRFVALSRKKMKAWLASDLSELDLLVIQIDGLHVGDHVLVAAIGVDGNGDVHVLAVVEGATENTVVVQALLDNLLARGLDPTLPRLFIVDGAKALSKAIRNTFGVAAAIQRCQVDKGRNIIERLPLHLHARTSRRRSVRPGTRTTQTRPSGSCATWPGVWSMRNRASRAASWIGWTRSSPSSASACRTNSGARSPAPTSSSTRSARCARSAERQTLEERRDGAQMDRRRPALRPRKPSVASRIYRQLPILRNALQEHLRKAEADSAIETIMKAA